MKTSHHQATLIVSCLDLLTPSAKKDVTRLSEMNSVITNQTTQSQPPHSPAFVCVFCRFFSITSVRYHLQIANSFSYPRITPCLSWLRGICTYTSQKTPSRAPFHPSLHTLLYTPRRRVLVKAMIKMPTSKSDASLPFPVLPSWTRRDASCRGAKLLSSTRAHELSVSRRKRVLDSNEVCTSIHHSFPGTPQCLMLP